MEKYSCRHFAAKTIPCNWCVHGLCGIDARLCLIKSVS
jgi:hypothetical protein